MPERSNPLQRSSSVFFLISLVAYAALLPFLSWAVFSEDDSHLMRVAVDYSWWQPFLVPEVYQQLSAANYTPMAMTFYKLLTSVFGFRPLAFVVFMTLALALFTALAGRVAALASGQRSAGLLAMLLIFSSLSVTTLLVRFYTMHYIIGGIFALTALLLLMQQPWGRGTRASPRSALLISLTLLLALLSKEVYLILPPLVVVLALWRRDLALAAAAGAALLIYLALRSYILGMSVDVGGESSYFAGAWSVERDAWLQFLQWYARTRALILIAVVAALWLNPRRMAKLLPLALLFVLPSLTVAHGIREFALHGDRLFFVFDCALAMAAAIAIAQAIPQRLQTAVQNPLLPGALLMLVFALHIHDSLAHKRELRERADYKITSYLLMYQDQLADKVLHVPLEFLQGDLMRVNTLLGRPPYEITQNCLQALQAEPEQLIAFDALGDQISQQTLAENCQPTAAQAAPLVNAVIAPRYRQGILEWELSVAEGFSGGVLFVDRAFAVPVPAFSRQLVRPRPGERYQLFARNGTEWWFSEVETMQVIP